MEFVNNKVICHAYTVTLILKWFFEYLIWIVHAYYFELEPVIILFLLI